jgi:hypothetical protein
VLVDFPLFLFSALCIFFGLFTFFLILVSRTCLLFPACSISFFFTNKNRSLSASSSFLKREKPEIQLLFSSVQPSTGEEAQREMAPRASGKGEGPWGLTTPIGCGIAIDFTLREMG